MLKAKLSNGLIVFGIDANNVCLLKDGKPIVIDMEIFGQDGTVCIMYGETLEDIYRELEKATGTKIPNFMGDQKCQIK